MASKRKTMKRRVVKKGKSRRVKKSVRRSRRYRGGTYEDIIKESLKQKKDLLQRIELDEKQELDNLSTNYSKEGYDNINITTTQIKDNYNIKKDRLNKSINLLEQSLKEKDNITIQD